MSPFVRISKETKRKLEAIQRDDETFDELLERLVIDRTRENVRETAGFGGQHVGEGMKKAREDLNESLDRRTEE